MSSSFWSETTAQLMLDKEIWCQTSVRGTKANNVVVSQLSVIW